MSFKIVKRVNQISYLFRQTETIVGLKDDHHISTVN